MTVWPVVVEIACTFALAVYLLHKYGNWGRHHILVTVNVFIAWYFSFIVIFILPLDVSTTAYKQCLRDFPPPTGIPSVVTIEPVAANITNQTNINITADNVISNLDTKISDQQEEGHCVVPWSHVPDRVLPVLWRVVYWTSQVLTWIIFPGMQSYSTAGDFTVTGKLKTALVENAIYYGTYLVIFGVLLIYVALQPGIHLDGSKLKVICITASNTWGLFLLVLLLGYGLVEIPRNCWNNSKRGHMLNYLYFKAAKLSSEKCEADEKLEDVLEEIQQASDSIPLGHPLRRHVETILEKCPEEWRNAVRNRRRQLDESRHAPAPAVTEKSLIRLHQQVIHALQTQRRTHCQWNMLVDYAFEWEDIARNEVNQVRYFKPTFITPRPAFVRAIYTPTIEWYWKCVIRIWAYRTLAVILGIFSVLVVWSEMTFFTSSPTLSMFAIFMHLARQNYNYVIIELLSIATIAYLCVCAYYTVFKVRVLNYYYLAPHHQTDEYSLIFCGMLLCRLTPPLCLNFLGLIHLDSHVTKNAHIVETAYTEIMGHMDVISIISDGFNIYFPICICVFCLATYFHFGSRILHFLGFEQFLGDDEMTVDLVEEGRELIKREKHRRQRMEEGEVRRRQTNQRINSAAVYKPARRQQEGGANLVRSGSEESAHAELLRDVEPIDYTEERASRIIDDFGRDDGSLGEVDMMGGSRNPSKSGSADSTSYQRSSWNRVGYPPKGLFDDV